MVVATFGMFFEQPFFYVHENDVGLDLVVIVIGGFAVAPGSVDPDVLVQRVP